MGSARDAQPHVGLPHGRSRLEVAGRRDLQARRHRQQGRQLPAQRRADGRRRDPAAEPGRAAHGRAMAEASTARRCTAPAPRRLATSSASRARRARRTCAASRCSCQNRSGAYTTKPGKLYFTFFDEPRAPFALPAMKNRVTRAYHLDGGADGEDDGREAAARSCISIARSSIRRPRSWSWRSRARKIVEAMTRRELLQLAASAPAPGLQPAIDGDRCNQAFSISRRVDARALARDDDRRVAARRRTRAADPRV